jgi:hypothetical protein
MPIAGNDFPAPVQTPTRTADPRRFLAPAIAKLALTGLSFFLKNGNPIFSIQNPSVGRVARTRRGPRDGCGMVDSRRTRVPAADPGSWR